jgi:hypothetical protein
LTRIFLGVFGRLLHSFGRFLKSLICYVRTIAHIVIRHSTAAIVADINLSFRLPFSLQFFLSLKATPGLMQRLPDVRLKVYGAAQLFFLPAWFAAR